jgi:hypothetical protein
MNHKGTQVLPAQNEVESMIWYLLLERSRSYKKVIHNTDD